MDSRPDVCGGASVSLDSATRATTVHSSARMAKGATSHGAFHGSSRGCHRSRLRTGPSDGEAVRRRGREGRRPGSRRRIGRGGGEGAVRRGRDRSCLHGRRERSGLGAGCCRLGGIGSRSPADPGELGRHRRLRPQRGRGPEPLGRDHRGQPHRHVPHVPVHASVPARWRRHDREHRVECRDHGSAVQRRILRIQGWRHQPDPCACGRVPGPGRAGERGRSRWDAHTAHQGLPLARGRERGPAAPGHVEGRRLRARGSGDVHRVRRVR